MNPKGYFCAAVRGPLGDDAPDEVVESNVRKAVAIAEKIQRTFKDEITLYIPHLEILPESLGPAEILRERGLIDHNDIVEADCIIAARQDFMIVLRPISGGMKQEMQAMLRAGKPFISIDDADDSSLEKIAELVMALKYEKVQEEYGS